MERKIKAYFETLEGLSTEALTDSAEKLVLAEKRNVTLLIAHIAEMSRRKAELECGYKNMSAFCVKRLNLSEGSVALRLHVANVSRRFPQILVALAENRISLTVAGHLAPHLRGDNVDKLLSGCAGMTKRAAEEYLEKNDPKKKLERRLERERKRNASQQKSRPDEISNGEGAPAIGGNGAKSRYIPSEVRERVLERAGHQCEFRGLDGTRCSSRTKLEIEHRRPFAIYRSHEERILMVLCHRHNRFQAERFYGAEFIRAKIDEKKCSPFLKTTP